VRGTVTSWSADTHKGVLKVVVEEAGTAATTAEVFMGFTFHDRAGTAGAADAVLAAAEPSHGGDGAAPLVLLTGAAGGLGGHLAAALAARFHVVALTNRRPLDASLRETANVTELPLSLASPDWERQLDTWRAGRPVYGIVHAAWPGAPQGGLLAVSDEVLEQQLHFGSTLTIRLARYLSASVGEEGRLVGKALLEHTVRLLAPELARKRITVNAVSPSVVATGMNAHLNDRQRLREVAQIPLGRLCEAADVAGAVEFLLSPKAAFLSGQSLALTGGQL
jgi:NAD(P)-dependent dehydrogenase (short-subunit alcohol dehydrogenase family)